MISHNAVIDILDKYTVETAEWRPQDLEKGDEDFFLQENIVPRRDNAFSTSADSHYSMPTDRPPLKKIKLADGTPLGSVQEVSDEGGEH